MTVEFRRRKRRKVRKEIKYGLFVIVTVLFVVLTFTFIIPLIDQMRLSSMGYSRDSARNIVAQKLTKTALSSEYSAAFDDNMSKNVIVDRYLDLYFVAVDIDDNDLLLYEKLLEIGYPLQQVLNAFEKINFKEITPLLVFNDVVDVDSYIDDIIANRDAEVFTLNNIYTKHYTKIKDITEMTSIDALINKYHMVNSDYVPELVNMSVQYASSGQQLQVDAYEAFKIMADAMKQDGLGGIYVYSGYRSYATQERIYNNYVKSKGQSWADRYSARPGHSEHQLGLAVDVTATKSTSSSFEKTDEYAWLVENAHKYGWILRYPIDKELITGYGYEPWHYRYLGEELATKVYESGLTYDEYCVLFDDVN
ncbi:MAG: M15 family metallopeptidase [Erysipelotrichaceae bacterium]|nr:M15 family metallopeptidase [Erysipelotrichaceae bacterium]